MTVGRKLLKMLLPAAHNLPLQPGHRPTTNESLVASCLINLFLREGPDVWHRALMCAVCISDWEGLWPGFPNPGTSTGEH